MQNGRLVVSTVVEAQRAETEASSQRQRGREETGQDKRHKDIRIEYGTFFVLEKGRAETIIFHPSCCRHLHAI
jgi:hypothetical protein